MDCAELKSVRFSRANNNNKISIGNGAFEGCINLERVEMSRFNGTKIGDNIFYGCCRLFRIKDYDDTAMTNPAAPQQRHDDFTNQAVIIRSSERSRGTTTKTLLFSRSWDETSMAEIGITKIGGGVFRDRKDLKEIRIPATIKTIGSDAFSGCTNLESVTIPKSVKKIGDGAFLGCINLKSVTFLTEGKKIEIGIGSFEGCESLTSVEIPDNVEEIGDGAFYGCKNLNKVEIKNSKIIIGVGVFEQCPALSSCIHIQGLELISNKQISLIKHYGIGNKTISYDDILNKMVDWIADEKNYKKWITRPYMWPMRHGRPMSKTKYEVDTINKFASFSLFDQQALQVSPDSQMLFKKVKEVLKWGGIRNTAPTREFANTILTLTDNTSIPTILRKGKGNSSSQYWRIASWSKILAAYKPGTYFIYDSRVAIGLSFILWSLLDDNLSKAPGVFWIIPKASDTTGAIEAFKETIHSVESDITTCYYLYLDLLKRLAKRFSMSHDSNVLCGIGHTENETFSPFAINGAGNGKIPSTRQIEEAYLGRNVFNNDKKKAIMAHLEKMLFMMKEPVLAAFGIEEEEDNDEND